MAAETAAARYDREWLQLGDDRKVRTFDQQSAERRNRTFVDENGNTTSATGDNVPA